jgi:CheY-like chemotaxis protein/anti-sigma regulatory factor (Ser/Thr protein kinase)
VDEGQLRQVLSNLFVNAMQAMPKGGNVEVRLENVTLTSGFLPPLAAGKYVKISIRDQGEGIKPEHLPRIFEPYFSTRKQGSGLGLATAYSVVRKHDGQIKVESAVGAGTAFHIYLPAAAERTPEPEEPAQKKFFGEGRLLVMDDEADILSIVREMLQSLGYEVETAKDGSEAIEKYVKAKVAGRPYEAVMMDLTIPNGMSGREAITRLREFDPGVKAVVSSGYSFDPVMANYRQFGFKGIIPKPYRIEELGRVLSEVVAKISI